MIFNVPKQEIKKLKPSIQGL